MNKLLKKMLPLVLALTMGTATFALTGCFDNGDNSSNSTSGSEQTVKNVTSVALDKEEATLEVGSELTLQATITPEDASNKKVTWESDDPTVATVDANGKVTAVAEGVAIITVTTEDGEKEAYCGITVIEAKGEVLFTLTDGESSIVVYEGGTFDFTGKALWGTVAIDVEPFSAEWEVVDNAINVKPVNFIAMGFEMPLGQRFAINANKEAVLTLYTNNGTSDFILGNFTFSAEQAASIGVNTDVTVLLATATNEAGDTIELYSDGVAKVNAVSMATIVGEIAYETTWAINDNVLTLAMQKANTLFGEFDMHAFVTITGAGLTITVKADNTNGGNPADGLSLAMVAIPRTEAIDKLGLDIPFIKVTGITLSETSKEMKSGENFDLFTLATVAPADATDPTVTVEVKEPTDVVRVSGTSIYAIKEGTAVVLVKAGEQSAEFTVTVTYPENTYTDAVAFNADKLFNGSTLGGLIEISFAFYSDGMALYTQKMNGNVFGSSMGYYTLVKDGDTVTAINVALFEKTAEGADQTYNFSVVDNEGTLTITDTSTADSNLGSLVEEVFEVVPFSAEKKFYYELDLTALGYGKVTVKVTFNADGTYTYVNEKFGQVFTETGKYAYVDGKITIVPDATPSEFAGKDIAVTETEGKLAFTVGDIALSEVDEFPAA